MDVLYRPGEPMPEAVLQTFDTPVLKSFEIRKENFPDKITFYGPGLNLTKHQNFQVRSKNLYPSALRGIIAR